jgi:hypothetical protein
VNQHFGLDWLTCKLDVGSSSITFLSCLYIKFFINYKGSMRLHWKRTSLDRTGYTIVADYNTIWLCGLNSHFYSQQRIRTEFASIPLWPSVRFYFHDQTNQRRICFLFVGKIWAKFFRNLIEQSQITSTFCISFNNLIDLAGLSLLIMTNVLGKNGWNHGTQYSTVNVYVGLIQ